MKAEQRSGLPYLDDEIKKMATGKSSIAVTCTEQKPYESFKPPDGVRVEQHGLGYVDKSLQEHFEENGHAGSCDGAGAGGDAGYGSSNLKSDAFAAVNEPQGAGGDAGYGSSNLDNGLKSDSFAAANEPQGAGGDAGYGSSNLDNGLKGDAFAAANEPQGSLVQIDRGHDSGLNSISVEDVSHKGTSLEGASLEGASVERASLEGASLNDTPSVVLQLAQALTQRQPEYQDDSTSSSSSIEVLSRQSSYDESLTLADYLYDEQAQNTGFVLEEDPAGSRSASRSSSDSDFTVLIPFQSPSENNSSASSSVLSASELLRRRLAEPSPVMYPPTFDYWPTANGGSLFLTPRERIRQAASIQEKRRIAVEDFMYQHGPITLQRDKIVQNFNDLYTQNPNLWKSRPMFGFEGEDGVDAGGITKDAVSTYWDEVRDEFLNDISFSLVPGVSEVRSEFHSQILAHGFLLTGQVPSYLHPLCIFGIFCSPKAVTPGFLQKCVELFFEDFNDSTQIKDLLIASCKSELQVDQKQQLKEFFEQYQCTLPKELTKSSKHFKELINENLFQNSMNFVRLCHEKLSEFLGVMTPSHAEELWESLRPTGEMIARRLRTPLGIRNSDEVKLIRMLKRWLHDNSDNVSLMERFLKWVTGSSALTEPHINVHFGSWLEISTCGNYITLPIHHKTYEEFVQMLMDELDSKSSQIFNQI